MLLIFLFVCFLVLIEVVLMVVHVISLLFTAKKIDRGSSPAGCLGVFFNVVFFVFCVVSSLSFE